MSFQRRYEELEPAAKYLADITKLEISAKPFNRLPLVISETEKMDEELRKPIESMWNRTRPYEVDGLIFNSADAKYLDTKMLKWKPNNSIDFLAIKCPTSLLGQAPYINRPNTTLYLLFVTINYSEFVNLGLSIIDGYEKVFPQYSTKHGGYVKPMPPGGPQSTFPIQFSPSFYPRAYLFYANTDLTDSDTARIFELYVDTTNQTDKNLSKIIEKGEPLPWKLIKIREDRQTDVSAGGYFGNYITIAESVSQNIINPFPIESLWSSNDVYFQEDKDPIYFAPMAFNSFVKSKLFINLKPDNIYKQHNTKPNNLLLDVAAGRGADIGRYSNGAFTQVVAVDNDIAALSELSRRKYSKHFTNIPAINTVQVNFNDDNVLEKLRNIGLPTQYDAISCNFAIHYVAKLDDFVKTIDSLLKPGGRFGFTCFDGGRINDLLKGKTLGDSWISLAENNFIKYQLQKMYIGDTLTNHGQIVNVKLPFSAELYSENLMNIDYIAELFKKRKYKIHTRKSFADFLADFSAENSKVSGRLTKEDIEFCSLYEMVIVERC
jgi:SAM-dependent methyltransferase